MEKKKEPSLSKSDLPKNMLRTPFDLVDDYQENKKGVVKLALPNDQLPTDALGQKADLVCDTGLSLEEMMETGLGDLLDGVKENPCASAAFIDPGSEEVHDKAIKEHETRKKLLLDSFNQDHPYVLSEGTPPDYTVNVASPYPTPEEMIASQNIGIGKLVHVTDKWFFYRVHQFHDVHHKRRKARFDKITFMLLRHSWTEYKESLYKKKYHIFDKTPRAKAERLAIKKIQSARSEGIRLS
ncbi:hypothetical protein [Klebsiella quasipneumoniae]|jgi:hypothetical protein|uniref:hypothetical protein n=1 Tax=Klebsiella quasipneumoniae TaxID=1463165 RepID=UPI0023B155D5|nr:hypothetical protein [Klebsiella quasipneumoniae]